MTQTERIQAMEQAFDSSADAVRALAAALDQYERNQVAYKKLTDYYGSTRWMKDYEADEKGKLPADLKRGVLSEDGVYNLMDDNRQVIARLLYLAAEMVGKNLFY